MPAHRQSVCCCSKCKGPRHICHDCRVYQCAGCCKWGPGHMAPNCLSPTKKHRRHGRGVRNGQGWQRTGEWTGRRIKRDGQMPSRCGEGYPISRTKHGGPWPLLHPHHPPSPTAPTLSVSSAVHCLTPPFFLLWTRLMSVTSNIKWGVMIQTLFLYNMDRQLDNHRHLHIPKT